MTPVAESPLCDLLPFNNKDNAFLWAASDNSDGGEGSIEKLAIRFRDAEEANEFKAAFNAGREFAVKAKKGETDLVFAPEVDDIKEEADDPDENVAHEDAS